MILLLVVSAVHAIAQESPSHTGSLTPLSELLAEAEKNNPQIEATRQSRQAAKQVPTQVSTLPDPQFNLQHVSVGSPRPFAGYTNSDFAYLGLGVSQDFPYPGKLRLKGEIAKRDADVSEQQIESVRRAVLAELKARGGWAINGFRASFVVGGTQRSSGAELHSFHNDALVGAVGLDQSSASIVRASARSAV